MLDRAENNVYAFELPGDISVDVEPPRTDHEGSVSSDVEQSPEN